MKKLQCQSCNSPLEWNEIDGVVTCGYCGMQYQMHESTPGERMRMSAMKSGCCAPRPILSGEDAGTVLYNCWLPEGWTYETGYPKDIFRYGSSMMTPICPCITLSSSDGRSWIRHFTTNGYIDPAGVNIEGSTTSAGMMASQSMFGIVTGTPTGGAMYIGKGGVQDREISPDPSSLETPSFIRYRPIVSASDYCDELLELSEWLSAPSIMSVQDELDDLAHKRREAALASLPDSISASMWWDWCRKLYRGMHAGVPYVMVVEAEVSSSGFNVDEERIQAKFRMEMEARQQQRQLGGGGFFSGVFGALANGVSSMNVPRSSLPRWWETDYEIVLACPADDFEELFPEFIKVLETIELGRDFKASQERIAAFIQHESLSAQNVINSAHANMAAARAASWERRSAIIQDANDHATAVMHDMMASNAASHDRSANMMSEMIGGYDVYRGDDGGILRADSAFDHVYQGTGANSDVFVGVEGDWLEPGVDFTPLGKIKGGDY